VGLKRDLAERLQLRLCNLNRTHPKGPVIAGTEAKSVLA
jgi:hypothetical protein